MKLIKLSLLMLAVAMFGFSADAYGQYILKKSVIGNGGGKTSNEAVSVAYTIGQPATGQAQNASFAGKFGFWYSSSGGPVPYTLDIQLSEGWNTISNYVIPQTYSMPAIWGDLAGNMLITKTGPGSTGCRRATPVRLKTGI
jgi:hypothetical protein